MEAEDHGRPLARLSRLGDYTVAKGDPDPRGRTVMDRGGHKVGEVKDLIVEVDRMRATYLEVELDTKLFDFTDDDPRILVPVDRAHVDGRRVMIEDITREWVAAMRAERDRHRQEFWTRWWEGRGAGRREGLGYGGRLERRIDRDEIGRAVEAVRPGEAVRIPVVEEEIVVERRPVTREDVREELIVNRDAGEPPARGE